MGSDTFPMVTGHKDTCTMRPGRWPLPRFTQRQPTTVTGEFTVSGTAALQAATVRNLACPLAALSLLAGGLLIRLRCSGFGLNGYRFLGLFGSSLAPPAKSLTVPVVLPIKIDPSKRTLSVGKIGTPSKKTDFANIPND